MWDFLDDFDWGSAGESAASSTADDSWSNFYDTTIPEWDNFYDTSSLGDTVSTFGEGAGESSDGNYDLLKKLKGFYGDAKGMYQDVGGPTALKFGGALYDMYNRNRIAKQLDQPLQQLNTMYQPGSPEAQAMERKLNARDAASGRRSQYGARAAELAGNLADARMRTLSSPGYLNLARAQAENKAGSLNSLFKFAQSNFANGGRVHKEFRGIPKPLDLSRFNLNSYVNRVPVDPAEGVAFGEPGLEADAPTGGEGSVGSAISAMAPLAAGILSGNGFGLMGMANAMSNAVTGQGLFGNLADAAQDGIQGLLSFLSGNLHTSSDWGQPDGSLSLDGGGDPDGIGWGMINGADIGSDGGADGGGADGGGGDGIGGSPGAGFSNGGKLPGHDTQGLDSIHARVGNRPIRLSGGEYIIPTDVVDKIGKDKLDGLVKMFHRPVRKGMQ